MFLQRGGCFQSLDQNGSAESSKNKFMLSGKWNASDP